MKVASNQVHTGLWNLEQSLLSIGTGRDDWGQWTRSVLRRQRLRKEVKGRCSKTHKIVVAVVVLEELGGKRAVWYCAD